MSYQNWNADEIEKELQAAYSSGLEIELLKVLRASPVLFYDVFRRSHSSEPVFHEVGFGGLRCDFAWLNDDSSGPEWVLVEVESPGMKLFRRDGKPSQGLSGALDQVKSWRRHFEKYPSDRSQVFGAVAKFRYVLIAGKAEDWSKEKAMDWRADHRRTSNIEIRSFGAFDKALDVMRNSPDELWAFEQKPKSLPPSKLKSYWKNHAYITKMRVLF